MPEGPGVHTYRLSAKQKWSERECRSFPWTRAVRTEENRGLTPFSRRVCSSVGQSTRLISVGSLVQIQPDPPVYCGGCSSVGRAPALQAGGHRFDPVHLHHSSITES